MRSGQWDERSKYMGCELRDRTLGVIGLGGIARKTIELLVGFGMKQPLAFDPFVNEVGGPPLNARFPRGALLAASFQSPPRLLNDLNRLFGTKVSDLFSDGGSVALYDVDTGTLLPRPLGVMILPPTAQRRATVQPLTQYGLRVAERPDELIVSFDRSIDTYLKDTNERAAITGGRWAARIDAQRIAPILHRLKDIGYFSAASDDLVPGDRVSLA